MKQKLQNMVAEIAADPPPRIRGFGKEVLDPLGNGAAEHSMSY